jgi:hypothetical protein
VVGVTLFVSIEGVWIGESMKERMWEYFLHLSGFPRNRTDYSIVCEILYIIVLSCIIRDTPYSLASSVYV